MPPPHFDEASLWQRGFARLGRLLTPDECAGLRDLYSDAALFRSRIDMARYRFGRGEYQYFAYPLPTIVQRLREVLYARLAGVARAWMAALGGEEQYPADLASFLERCRRSGQQRPTPLLLRYGAGDFNCLHQDLYGAVVFPFQVIVGLSVPGAEYSGGELLVVEQQPRAQSKGQAVRLEQGEGVVITTRYRPAKGQRGMYRVNVRHGVSVVEQGERFTLGVIFHDGE